MRNGFIDDDRIRQKLMAELNRGGITRPQMAERLGISRPFLSQFLTRARPHASAEMLKALGYEPDHRYYRRVD